MKTSIIKIENYKDTSLTEVAFELFGDNNISDEESDIIYESASKIFEYGEYLNMIVEVDENLNIIGGKLIPYKDDWRNSINNINK